MGALAAELPIPACCASEKTDKARVSKMENIVRCGVCVSLWAFLCVDDSCSGVVARKQLKVWLSDQII